MIALSRSPSGGGGWIIETVGTETVGTATVRPRQEAPAGCGAGVFGPRAGLGDGVSFFGAASVLRFAAVACAGCPSASGVRSVEVVGGCCGAGSPCGAGVLATSGRPL